MNRIIFIIIFGLIIYSHGIQSQQLYQYSQYMARPILNNPAAAGMHEAACIFGGGRYQWIGYTDQDNENVYPRNYVVGATMPVYSINSGIGVQFYWEQMGYQSRMDLRLDYAYKIGLKNEKYLSLGLNAQLSRTTLDLDKLNPADSQDPLLLEGGEQADILPEAGFGIFYHSPGIWWAGVSILNLAGSTATLGNLEMKDQRTIIAQGQYKINIKDERSGKFDLAPSFLLKSNFTSTQVELDILTYLDDRYWFGAGYRFQDGLIILAGAQISSFNVGISYDYTTGKVREAAKTGTVEVHLGYCIPLYPRVECHSGFNVRHL